MKIAKIFIFLAIALFLFAACEPSSEKAEPPETPVAGEVSPEVEGVPAEGTIEPTPPEGGGGGTALPTVTLYKLRVNLTGQGGVHMEAAHLSAAFHSPARFYEVYLPDVDVVTFTATPDSGWVLAGYSGACGGTTCTLAMDSNKVVNVEFGFVPAVVPVPMVLIASLDLGDCGSGRLTSAPSGIDCGVPGVLDCGEEYMSGSTILLTPTLPAHCEVKSWVVTGAGPCTGQECNVLLTENDARRVTVMALLGLKHYVLTVRVSGMGDVDMKAGGISVGNCSPTGCAPSSLAPFAAETAIMLEAVPRSGYGFIGWEGEGISCPVGAPPFRCNFSMTGDMTVTAKFTAPTIPRPLYAPEFKYPFRNELTPVIPPGGPHPMGP